MVVLHMLLTTFAIPDAHQATTTALCILGLTSLVHSPILRTALGKRVRRFATLAGLTVICQVTLGITTLLYLVPTPLAAAHQAGSVVLLTAMTGLAVSLRRPSSAAQLLRRSFIEASAKAGGGKQKPVVPSPSHARSTSQ